MSHKLCGISYVTPVVPLFATPKLSEKLLRKGVSVAKRGKLPWKWEKLWFSHFELENHSKTWILCAEKVVIDQKSHHQVTESIWFSQNTSKMTSLFRWFWNSPMQNFQIDFHPFAWVDWFQIRIQFQLRSAKFRSKSLILLSFATKWEIPKYLMPKIGIFDHPRDHNRCLQIFEV